MPKANQLLAINFFLLGMCLCILSKAQLVNPSVFNWFELENFFYEKAIVDHNIEAIHIKIDEKKDGEKIKKKGDFLHYEFNENGQLVESLQNVKLAKKDDTLKNLYSYNKDGLLSQKDEIHPPFYFSYHYSYSKAKAISEVKIDEQNPEKDTVHYLFKYQTQAKTLVKEISYSNGLTFKKEQTEIDNKGRLSSFKVNYKRGGAYLHTSYYYDKGVLKKVKFVKQFSKKEEVFKQFFYETEILNEILVFEDGSRTKKLALTYKENGLIDAVIERDFDAKRIKIYYFLYKIRT